ncbi:nitrogen fixation protein FixI [Phyllobacterium phragmitis]|uniref:Nitrogen fixation protein FixI n=1 Tax=Phyllobacterium phragmitis TaxID=2670329 RepID=A0A2S9IMV8_9HYPH|nr:cation-translocating P-type ATPase [Phyllobacterium phragmitis]PRD41856.1 nitrogen fixation protein FixI [Phyllobacterium phragmitis]
MTCCAVATPMALDAELARSEARWNEELKLESRDLGNGLHQVELSVPDVHCAACIQKIETALAGLAGVDYARVNLSTKRLSVRWREGDVPAIFKTLHRLGYPPHLFDNSAAGEDRALSQLIRAVAISGFAAGNIMLLSVSVWSGAEGATRDLFHWISALIAVPALIFAGGIFYRSAWNALRHGRMNMDVPIALGVSLAYGMSLYEVINHGPHAYFDAAASLLFFLLIGRTLDHVMREKARSAVTGLVRLAARGAVVLRADGSREFLPLAEIEPDMRVLIAAGERIPVDGVIREGASSLDCSLVTGESDPQRARPGDMLRAGTLNLTGPLMIEVTAGANGSFLAEIVRLMETVEAGRGGYRRLADRASALYSPVVHLTALITFFGWMAVSGDWHRAITIAIAVLIITCPCALGLAVPIVQVVAARRLFENGIMVKDGSAMERLAEIDTAVFDKTGTLTLGKVRLKSAEASDEKVLLIAGLLASHSSHPASRAISEACPGEAARIEEMAEIAGLGIEGRIGGELYRLGRASWAVGQEGGNGATVLSRDGKPVASFTFEDTLRPDAGSTIRTLASQNIAIEMLSGDRAASVRSIAHTLGIETCHAEVLPAGKLERLSALAAEGRKALMVGDGLNDAPALAAAHVSMAPASAADIGRNAADFVFLRDSLCAVPLALAVSRNANRLIRQNFALALVYNAIAVPVAIFGYVTPLVAAVSMSVSSILVVANALRLRPSVPCSHPAALYRRAGHAASAR